MQGLIIKGTTTTRLGETQEMAAAWAGASEDTLVLPEFHPSGFREALSHQALPGDAFPGNFQLEPELREMAPTLGVRSVLKEDRAVPTVYEGFTEKCLG